MDQDYGVSGAPRTVPGPGRPTGFRRLTPGLLRADEAARAFQGLPADVTAPGQLLATFKAAAPRLGLSIRLVHAVDWLFRFTQPQDWDADGRPIVWPSAETQRQGLGLSVTQVKAINRCLIEAGLITMRDSPNGKRYGTRDRRGRVVEAYGFDLSPLCARHAEFAALAEADRLERQQIGQLRRRITIARKGIAQILETVREYGLAADGWSRLEDETRHLVRSLKQVEAVAVLEVGTENLERRHSLAREQLEHALGIVDTDPMEAKNRPHNTSTTEMINLSDTVVASKKGSSEIPASRDQPPKQETEPGFPRTNGSKLAPHELVRLAPRLKAYLRGPDPTWRDIVDAADWLRDELDISKPLWGEACLLLGREGAATAVALVSTKDRSYFQTTPGGYFHGMLKKAKAQELNLDRTIWKLRHAANSGKERSAYA